MENTKPRMLILTAATNGQYEGSAIEKNNTAWGKALQNYAPEYAYFTAAINDVHIQVQNGVVTIFDRRNGYKLEDYAFVQFRNVRFTRDHFMAIAHYLTRHRVPFTDADDVVGTPFGKISQMVLFALNGITVPDTLAVWPDTALSDVQQFTQLPFIMKANHGIKGHNNYLVHSWEEFEKLLETHGSKGYVVQPFIPNDGDYRFLYLGDECLAFYRQAQGETHLNNSSQGGSGTLVDTQTCDANIVRIARQTMQCYGREIGGVDVLVDKTTNKPYILEVNDTPAIPSGLFQKEKILRYTAFMRTKIEEEL